MKQVAASCCILPAFQSSLLTIVAVEMPAQSSSPIKVQTFKPDKVVGILIIVISALALIAGVLAILLGAVMAPVDKAVAADDKDGLAMTGSIHLSTTFTTIGWLAIVISILQILCGIGILRSNRASFLAGVVLAILSLLGGGFTSVTGVAVGIYVSLRLWGNLGPKLDNNSTTRRIAN